MITQTQVGPQILSDGATPPQRSGKMGDQIVSELHGRYYEQAYRKNIFVAQAIVTTPVIYTTAAGTGGPLLWNGSANINCVLLKVGWAQTVTTAVAGALGITGGTGQTSAPTATTAIDGTRNTFLGGPASNATAYRIGTPTNPGNFLFPFAQIGTGATTVDVAQMTWIDLEGSIIVPPNAWAAISASATLTSAVFQIGLMWEEVPI
jgi:hypothetical protein